MGAKTVGQLGEDIAIEYLKKKGFAILDQNFVYRIAGAPQKAEIDIIAKHDDVISFVEVKTSVVKTDNPSWSPEERVNYVKQQKITQAAEIWLMKANLLGKTPFQIDIIAVLINATTQKAKIRYLPNIN